MEENVKFESDEANKELFRTETDEDLESNKDAKGSFKSKSLAESKPLSLA